MATIASEQRALVQQGYDLDPRTLRELAWALRFTPLVCMGIALVGLATRQSAIHFGLAVLGIAPFWFPRAHPLDLLYNRVLAPLWGGVGLPPNPLPRRIACLMGGAMNLGIGFAFLAGHPFVAYALGAVLVALQIVVITTHFCVASWMYESLLRALGRFVAEIPIDRARELVSQGAALIDVREPHEFAAGHLDGARNVPLDRVVETLKDARDRPLLLYCASGLRSQRAVQMLRRSGNATAHNLGGMSRWKRSGA